MLGIGGDLGPLRNAIQDFKPQIAFNLVEAFDDVSIWDANVVAYLELLKVPYTGCNSRGLVLSRDKALAKKVLSYHRMPLADFAVFPRGRSSGGRERLRFPLIVKSLTLDASIGISQASVVEDDEKLEERVRFIHEIDRHRRARRGVHRGPRAVRRHPGRQASRGAADLGAAASTACPRSRARSPPSG